VIALLRSLRSLILGETWTIPLGVAAAVGIGAVASSAFADHAWDELGGFLLAAMIAITLVASISLSSRR
jgi:ABC-type phosphate/phosphonate transport system permease subunit